MYFGFRDIYVDYGKKEVLQGLTLDIPKGKVVTLIGQNGCGKSTLLKTVSKAVSPRHGVYDKILFFRRFLRMCRTISILCVYSLAKRCLYQIAPANRNFQLYINLKIPKLKQSVSLFEFPDSL